MIQGKAGEIQLMTARGLLKDRQEVQHEHAQSKQETGTVIPPGVEPMFTDLKIQRCMLKREDHIRPICQTGSTGHTPIFIIR